MNFALTPVHASLDDPAGLVEASLAATKCRPHLVFSEDDWMLQFVRKDPCLSICCLPKEEYDGYTRIQRALSAIVGLGLLLICVRYNTVAYSGGDAAKHRDDAARDSFYRAHTSPPGYAGRIGDNDQTTRCCEWSLERAGKTCSTAVTQDMLCSTCAPPARRHDRNQLDPSTFSCYGQQWNGTCGFTVEQCQAFAASESTCTDTITYGTNEQGMAICRCVRAGRGRLREHRDDDKTCDFVDSVGGKYDVYRRTCSCVDDLHNDYDTWEYYRHSDYDTITVFHVHEGVCKKYYTPIDTPLEDDMCFTDDGWFEEWIGKKFNTKMMHYLFEALSGKLFFVRLYRSAARRGAKPPSCNVGVRKWPLANCLVVWMLLFTMVYSVVMLVVPMATHGLCLGAEAAAYPECHMGGMPIFWMAPEFAKALALNYLLFEFFETIAAHLFGCGDCLNNGELPASYMPEF